MKSTGHIRVMKQLLLGTLSLFAIGLLAACGGYTTVPPALLNATQASQQPSGDQKTLPTLSFPLVPASSAIQTCLPNARIQATILPDTLNDTMTVQASGLVPNQKYTLFVTQTPNKPFGISWYQGAIFTDDQGAGSVVVRGILDPKTFSVAPGGTTTTFAPTNQYHLGLWFSDPQTPFKLGCEPGASTPMVTPFNGAHHAGILALNTSNFPDTAGPLSKVQH